MDSVRGYRGSGKEAPRWELLRDLSQVDPSLGCREHLLEQRLGDLAERRRPNHFAKVAQDVLEALFAQSHGAASVRGRQHRGNIINTDRF